MARSLYYRPLILFPNHITHILFHFSVKYGIVSDDASINEICWWLRFSKRFHQRSCSFLFFRKLPLWEVCDNVIVIWESDQGKTRLVNSQLSYGYITDYVTNNWPSSLITRENSTLFIFEIFSSAAINIYEANDAKLTPMRHPPIIPLWGNYNN